MFKLVQHKNTILKAKKQKNICSENLFALRMLENRIDFIWS